MTVPWETHPWEDEPDGSNLDDLATILRRQRETLAAVATGTSIASKQDEYSHRYRRLRRAYEKHGLDNPFPWPDLNSFWVYIRDDWPTYATRRAHLAETLEHALDDIEAIDDGVDSAAIPSWDLPLDERWTGLAQRALDLKSTYEAATTIDDYEDVGRRSRQIILAAIKTAWDETMVPEGENRPREDDGPAKLDQLLDAIVPGGR